MEKVKKILKPISIIFISIIGILFIISIFDYAIHFKTYSGVDRVFGNLNELKKKYQCNENYKYIMKHTRYAAVQGQAKSMPPEFLTPAPYDKALSSCKLYEKSLNEFKVPEDIPADKQKLLNTHIKLNAHYAYFLSFQIENAKKCKGDLTCLRQPDPFVNENFYRLIRTVIKMDLAQIEAEKRFSIGYLLKLPSKHRLEKDLVQINQTPIQSNSH